MAEDLNKKPEELQEEQLDEVNGGKYPKSILDMIKKAQKIATELSSHKK